MEKITPCLWFDGKAEEAARFYVSVFEDGKLLAVTHYGENAPQPAGTVMTVLFSVNGQTFMGLNAGPAFTFSPAVSFMVNCDTQAEIDRYWARLSEGGQEVECGWVRDRFGLSWQIVPRSLGAMMASGDPAAVQRMVQAVWTMKKLDLAVLEKAFRREA
ncbi:VOC family protein [Mesoterricola silvestris]|uniref:VOC family protein n=1 Tax=Mesoterricola silvestris TaxID=2927979 RepID=A0AA48GRR9_9BACT|nr:VOC family protein [Mesoterricola silvestris]BDU73020.1 VOC family protein [Mesoterricola silvestris]